MEQALHDEGSHLEYVLKNELDSERTSDLEYVLKTSSTLRGHRRPSSRPSTS